MTDIVETLQNGWTTVPQVLAAAEEIKRLRAELAQANDANNFLLKAASDMEAERDALRELLDEVRPIVAETQTFDGHMTDTPSGLLARIDAARRKA